MSYLKGKTLLLTGGGRAVLSDGTAGSIGYGIATAFAKEGANIVITGRNMQKLLDAKEELERLYGIKVLPVQADVSAGADNAATAAMVVEKAIAEFGRIDVLINNAQASASGVTLADHTLAQFDLAIYSGLYATFHYMQACYPYLKETKGSVINFASGAGLFGNYGQCAYAAAKEGIRPVPRGCHRVGQGRHQCQHRCSPGLDRSAGELPEGISRGIQGQCPYASHGPLRQPRVRYRPRLCRSGRPRLQVYVR